MLGGCVGASWAASLTGRGATGALCYEAAPDGTHGIVVTGGGVGTSGAGLSGLVGIVDSNGPTLEAQSGLFTNVGGSVGDGLESGGGEVELGTYDGKPVWTVIGGWTPSADDGYEVHLGETVSKVYLGR